MWWDIGKIWLTSGSCIVNDLRGMAKVIVIEVVLNDWPFTGIGTYRGFSFGRAGSLCIDVWVVAIDGGVLVVIMR